MFFFVFALFGQYKFHYIFRENIRNKIKQRFFFSFFIFNFCFLLLWFLIFLLIDIWSTIVVWFLLLLILVAAFILTIDDLACVVIIILFLCKSAYKSKTIYYWCLSLIWWLVKIKTKKKERCHGEVTKHVICFYFSLIFLVWRSFVLFLSATISIHSIEAIQLNFWFVSLLKLQKEPLIWFVIYLFIKLNNENGDIWLYFMCFFFCLFFCFNY